MKNGGAEKCAIPHVFCAISHIPHNGNVKNIRTPKNDVYKNKLFGSLFTGSYIELCLMLMFCRCMLVNRVKD